MPSVVEQTGVDVFFVDAATASQAGNAVLVVVHGTCPLPPRPSALPPARSVASILVLKTRSGCESKERGACLHQLVTSLLPSAPARLSHGG